MLKRSIVNQYYEGQLPDELISGQVLVNNVLQRLLSLDFPTPIKHNLTLTVVTLGAGTTVIRIGNSLSQTYRLRNIGDSITLFVKRVNDIWVLSDSANISSLDYIGS